MQGQKHFRIVCLKNEPTNRGVPERNRHANIVMSERSEIRSNTKADLQPSLAYLSARLQDEAKSSSISNVVSARERTMKDELCESIKVINGTEMISGKKERSPFKQTLDIEKYFEKKQLFLDGSKNTMRNLIGSIDFQLHKKKEKLTCKAIKSTINDNVLGQRTNKFYSKKKTGTANRTFMEGDFHSFLANKQREKIKLEKSLEQRDSQVQLHKLLIVNPEKTEDLPSGQNVHLPINLFHFQKTQGREQQSIRVNNSMGSKLHIESSAADRKMMQRKMFEKKMFWLRPTLKTDAEDFEWSRMHDHKYTVEVISE